MGNLSSTTRVMSLILACLGLMTACGGDGGNGGTDPPAIDLTGTWSGTISSNLVSDAEIDLVLTQSGTDLTGTYSVVATGAEGTVSGTINGNDVTFTLAQTTPGCEGSFSGTGTASETTITFTYSGNDCLGAHTDGQGTVTKQSGEPDPATQLAFTVQPTDATAGAPITPAVEVVARDAQGATATDFTGNVTVAIGTNPSDGTLSGTTTVAAVAGVATFDDLSIDNAGSGYTFEATASGLADATSAAFDVSGGAAVTRLYLSPLLQFRLRPNPTAQSNTVFFCVASQDWSAALAEDIVGTVYRFSLGVQTDFMDTGSGTLQADIIHKRGATETVLASTTFTTTETYEINTAELTGPDPAAQAGDSLVLRVLRIDPSPGLPCVVELFGPATDNFIEVPETAVVTD